MINKVEKSTSDLKLVFLGGVGSVTGANFLLQKNSFNLMIDCGMLQGSEQADEYNKADFVFSPLLVDAVIITHAHMDHIGRLPKLIKDGFKGPIYSTAPTKELSELMLADGARIVLQESSEKGEQPWYEQKHVDQAMSQWKTVPYKGEFVLGEDFKITLLDAGHILGSAMAVVEVDKKKILFTGDLGNSPMPLLRDTSPVPDVDYVVTESVYGDREHDKTENRLAKLERIIEDTIRRQGALVIPIFSLERTQEILYELNNLVEQKKVPSVPVFLDSPLAIAVTDIYEKYINYFNSNARTQAKFDDLFNFSGLKFTLHKEDSKKINGVPNPKIILAGSGMSHAGRVIYHERKYIPDPNSTILFVGYQGVGTFGRLLQSKPRYVDIFGEKVRVRCKIETIKGYSGHKDLPGLLEFMSPLSGRVKKVFCVMGETKASGFLAQRLRDYYTINAEVPYLGQEVVLK